MHLLSLQLLCHIIVCSLNYRRKTLWLSQKVNVLVVLLIAFIMLNFSGCTDRNRSLNLIVNQFDGNSVEKRSVMTVQLTWLATSVVGDYNLSHTELTVSFVYENTKKKQNKNKTKPLRVSCTNCDHVLLVGSELDFCGFTDLTLRAGCTNAG